MDDQELEALMQPDHVPTRDDLLRLQGEILTLRAEVSALRFWVDRAKPIIAKAATSDMRDTDEMSMVANAAVSLHREG